MYVERLLQVNVATLASLSALMLGMGERSTLLPLGVLLAAVLSVWLTDVTGWFRLNQPVTNVAKVLAVLLLLWEVVELRSSMQVFAIANLLVYLQLVLLFQEKDTRTYWQLITLSLLQVVVASAFNQGALFGLLLVVYLAASLSAMVLLFLYRERSLHVQAAEVPPAPSRSPGRWPLAGQGPMWTNAGAGRSGRGIVGRELWGPIGKIVFGTLVFAMAFFFAVPRLSNSAWTGPGAALRQTVGFSDEVTLGELGRIIENRQEVLRIRFLDEATEEPYEVHGEIYLRGSVLTQYRRGRWLTYEHPDPGDVRPVVRGALLPGERLVRQVITIEPMDRPELFCVWPFLGAEKEPDRRIFVSQRRQRLLRAEEYMAKQFTFALATPAFDHGLQSSLTPSEGRVRRQALMQLPPRDALPGLIALAEEWLGDSSIPAGDRFAQARYLERMLRDSGRFAYSLEGQARDRSLDPIEDFVTRHPRGHCEYFATALVLMLRSQGIPARLVVGFKSDEWNDLGGFFQVRQLHAHTWVEAYLEPRHLPDHLIRGERHWEWADGAWLRLDPTPAGQGNQGALASLVQRMDGYLGWIDYLWDTYVVKMDSPRQREAIYRPVAQAVERVAKRVTDPAWWRAVFASGGRALQRLVARLGIGGMAVGVGLALAATLAILLASYGFGLGPRRLLDRLAGQASATKGSSRSRVEFYRRLESLLARQGLIRAPQQTPREYACRAGAALVQTTGQAELASLPAQVVDAFYRVRFGGLPLDPGQTEAVETALVRLEQATSEQPKAKPPDHPGTSQPSAQVLP